MNELVISRALLLLAFVTPISIAGTSILFFPMLAAAVLGFRWVRPYADVRIGMTERAFAVLIGISALSALAGDRPMHGLHELLKDFYVLIALLIVALARRLETGDRIVRVFVVASAGTAILGIVQSLTDLNLSEPHHGIYLAKPSFFAAWPGWATHYLSELNARAVGTRSHPLTYAEGLLFALAASLSYLTAAEQRHRGRWLMATWSLGGGLLVSQSRGPWLAAVAMVPIILLTRRTRVAFLWTLLALAPLVLLMASPRVSARVASIADRSHHSNAERLHMWTVGSTLIREHLWLGIGPGNVRKATAGYLTAQERADGGWGHLHSNIINLLVERGLLGFLAWLFLFGVIALEVRNACLDPAADPRVVTIALATLAGLVGFLVSGLTETNYNDTEVLMSLYLLAGAGLAVARRRSLKA